LENNVKLQDIVQVREARLGAIHLVGFQGERLEDQNSLFVKLNESMSELSAIKSDHPYLVILTGLVPLVAVECEEAGDVPEGMTPCTIPENDYAVFRLEERHIGDFWSTVCTAENQRAYRIDLAQPRFEIFNPELLSQGRTEWYIPLMKSPL